MKLFMIAGEKSGDKQGALLIQELLRRNPDIEIVGLGGSRMHALAPGVEDWAEQAAVIGIVEVLKQDPRPQYHDDPERKYGVAFAGHDVRFTVENGVLTVFEVVPLK